MGKKKKNRVPEEVAYTVKDRANFVCEAMIPEAGCNGRAQQLHHRKMRSQGGEHTVQNLLHICSPCHNYIHAHPAISYENGHLVSGWKNPNETPVNRRGGFIYLTGDGGFEDAPELYVVSGKKLYQFGDESGDDEWR